MHVASAPASSDPVGAANNEVVASNTENTNFNQPINNTQKNAVPSDNKGTNGVCERSHSMLNCIHTTTHKKVLLFAAI